jgi:hypothetical protein
MRIRPWQMNPDRKAGEMVDKSIMQTAETVPTNYTPKIRHPCNYTQTRIIKQWFNPVHH